MAKFDFYHLLRRRRIPLERWIADEGIKTRKDFENWMKFHDHELFSRAFVDAVNALLQQDNLTEKTLEKSLKIENTQDISSGSLSEITESTTESKKQQKNKVQTSQRN